MPKQPVWSVYRARRWGHGDWLVDLNGPGMALVSSLFALLPLVMFPVALFCFALDVLFLLLLGMLLYQVRLHDITFPLLSLAQFSLPVSVCLL